METKLKVGRATRADEEAIIKLERFVWGMAEEATLKYFQWLTLLNPSGQAITHIVKDGSDQILAMHIVVPVPAIYKGNLLKAGLSVNIATHPDYRRKGLSTKVATSVYREAKQFGIDLLFSVPNSVSRALFTQKNGFIELIRPLMLTRWIDPSIFLRQHGFYMLEKFTKFLTRPFLKNSLRRGGNSSRIKFLKRLDDLKLDSIYEPVDFCIAPDANWLRWRYDNHPFRKYEHAIIGELDSPQVFVTYHVLEQYGRALILEFLASQNVPLETIQTLIDAVVEKCRSAGSSSMISLGMPNSRKTNILKECGFWVFPFSSVWRPHLVFRNTNLAPSMSSPKSVDIAYGSLINIE